MSRGYDGQQAQVAVVIPCYRAKGLVANVVAEVLRVGDELTPVCLLRVLVVNDAPPAKLARHRVPPTGTGLHHRHNRGVGAATITGLNAALQIQCQAMVKLDADGQPTWILTGSGTTPFRTTV